MPFTVNDNVKALIMCVLDKPYSASLRFLKQHHNIINAPGIRIPLQF